MLDSTYGHTDVSVVYRNVSITVATLSLIAFSESDGNVFRQTVHGSVPATGGTTREGYGLFNAALLHGEIDAWIGVAVTLRLTSPILCAKARSIIINKETKILKYCTRCGIFCTFIGNCSTNS